MLKYDEWEQLKKHSKGSQAQGTQVKIQFSLLHLMGLSVIVEGNFVADSKLMQLVCRLHPDLPHDINSSFVTLNRIHKYIFCTLENLHSLH